MEKVLTVLSFFLLVLLITTFPLSSASASEPQDSCCGSTVESVIASPASSCICHDIQIDVENLALINVTMMMMMMKKLHTVCGVSLPCDVDAPESHGLENSMIANSAESPSSSSQSMSKAQPDSTAPTSVEVPDDNSSDASLWIIFIVFFLLLITGACCED